MSADDFLDKTNIFFVDNILCVFLIRKIYFNRGMDPDIGKQYGTLAKAYSDINNFKSFF